jgi:hypothetical protein
MSEKKMDLALRRRVAELDGWDGIELSIIDGHLKGVDLKENRWQHRTPQYEISFDAIAEACDRHNIGFDLKGFVDDKEGYKYSASYSGDDIAIVGGIGFTRAIAVCHLFVAVMTERLRQEERAMERDRLGRKIAEEALVLASFHPDFKQADEERDRLVKALTLRRKVATLAGWADFFIGEVQQELWGTPPLGSSNVKVPHYETNFNEISRLFTANGLMYERETYGDNIESPNKNVLYTEQNTRITGCGETAEIALCNLFVAVMEARLEERPRTIELSEGVVTTAPSKHPFFSPKISFTPPCKEGEFKGMVAGITGTTTVTEILGREARTGEDKLKDSATISGDRVPAPFTVETLANPVGRAQDELVKIETLFTRSLLKQIREKANEQKLSMDGYTWRAAYSDLAIAADRLDAMLARKEWAKNEYGGEERE